MLMRIGPIQMELDAFHQFDEFLSSMGDILMGSQIYVKEMQILVLDCAQRIGCSDGWPWNRAAIMMLLRECLNVYTEEGKSDLLFS